MKEKVLIFTLIILSIVTVTIITSTLTTKVVSRKYLWTDTFATTPHFDLVDSSYIMAVTYNDGETRLVKYCDAYKDTLFTYHNYTGTQTTRFRHTVKVGNNSEGLPNMLDPIAPNSLNNVANPASPLFIGDF